MQAYSQGSQRLCKKIWLHYDASLLPNKGGLIHELERSPDKRKCKHLARCKRVADFVRSSSFGEQMSMDIINSDLNLKGVNES